MVRAYVGIGSNLGDPLAQVSRALTRLAQLPGVDAVIASPLYRSAPLGPQDQPDYVNAVAALDTELAPHALLDALQALEQEQGRVRGAQRWGPRTLDLDLLLYGDLQLVDARLTLPHPGLHERAFVLYPLRDIAPDLDIPGHGPLGPLVARCSDAGLVRLATGVA
ncbi:2-amino-4-hydroxy-6-hydroxymethyldihydropteridine diphosphokinase [Ectothiorhodospiraceae bacterium 2226]|nr:2-amino-4-hydroxy-6-hydroxymethyldihydropteridine diphosphokinase [Ectothiorhodospiraceae bacterium 2226]